VPLVDGSVIEQFIASSSDMPGMTICPSLDGDGTNALLLRPVTAIRPTFGPRSYHKHIEQARSGGQSVTVTQLAQLALDIDEPADLDRFLSMEAPTHARAMLGPLVSR
jgi:2-phospho-L-lactate guanylyltransferase